VNFDVTTSQKQPTYCSKFNSDHIQLEYPEAHALSARGLELVRVGRSKRSGEPRSLEFSLRGVGGAQALLPA